MHLKGTLDSPILEDISPHDVLALRRKLSSQAVDVDNICEEEKMMRSI